MKNFISAFTTIIFIILPNFALVSFAATPQCAPTIPTSDGCPVGFRPAKIGEGCDGLCVAGVKEPTASQPNPDSFKVETQSGGSGSTAKIPVTPTKELGCPEGKDPYYTDKYGEFKGCIVPAIKITRDAKGNITEVICPKNSSAFYDRDYEKGAERAFKACLEPPSIELVKTGIGNITKQKGGYETFLQIPCQSIFGGTCPKASAGPAQYIARLYQFGLMIAGFLAFGSIVFGSLQYILSAGNLSSTEAAKETIGAAIAGLLLLFSAYLILYTINPKLVNLANPSIVPLQIDQIPTATDTETQQQNNPYIISTEAHPLCQSGINTGVTVNTNIEFGGIKRTKINEKGEAEAAQEIKSQEIPQASFICLQCKANATKSSIGECACNDGYEQSGNQCISIKTKK